jgi:hypothetical protein
VPLKELRMVAVEEVKETAFFRTPFQVNRIPLLFGDQVRLVPFTLFVVGVEPEVGVR